MKCETRSENIMRYFDKDLNDIEVGKLKQHLKLCQECNSEFEELNKIIGSLETIEMVEPPDNFEELVMKRIKALNNNRKRLTNSFLITGYGLMSAMLLCVAAILVGYFQEISFLEVIVKLTGVFDFIIKILQALSVSEAGTVLYGLMVISFTIMLGYTGIIIFMDPNNGGGENEAKK